MYVIISILNITELASILMQDEAPAHYYLRIINYLNTIFLTTELDVEVTFWNGLQDTRFNTL